jgi:NADPH:quinone reductase-like Zn-dependent oxidoreductase
MKKILQFNECGGPEKLSLINTSVKEPQGTEVRFNVKAFALNQADLLYLRGEHTIETEFPSRIGSEATGVVDAIGPDVTRFKVGDKVSSIPFMSAHYGVAGEYAIVPEHYVTHAVDGLSDVANTSIWMQYLTAYFPFVYIAKLQAGDSAFIAAGASSAGIAAIQLAKSLGVKTIATTRSVDKKDFLLAQGADAVLLDGVDNFYDAIMNATKGKGIELAYDPIGGQFMGQYALAMAKYGKVFHYGALSTDADELPMLDFLRRAAVIYPYSLFSYAEEYDLLTQAIQFVRQKLASTTLTPVIDSVFTLEAYQEAFSYMLSNKQRGKIVVTVN